MSRECALRSLERWRRAREPPPEGVRLAQRLEDGKPFAYPAAPAPSSSAGGAVVLCLLPKVGSTTWKLALLSKLLPISRKRLLTRSPHRNAGCRASGLLLLRTAPRIIIVRDPYDRLLSGRLRQDRHAKNRAPRAETVQPGDTAAFVGNLRAPPEEAIVPAAAGAACAMDRGLGYDYVLPVEDIGGTSRRTRAAASARSATAGTTARAGSAAATSAFAPPCKRCDGMFSCRVFSTRPSTAARQAAGRWASDPRASTRPTRGAEPPRRHTPYTRSWPRSGSGGLEALGYPART